jgi:hypothetical protein
VEIVHPLPRDPQRLLVPTPHDRKSQRAASMNCAPAAADRDGHEGGGEEGDGDRLWWWNWLAALGGWSWLEGDAWRAGPGETVLGGGFDPPLIHFVPDAVGGSTPRRGGRCVGRECVRGEDRERVDVMGVQDGSMREGREQYRNNERS